MTWIKKRIPKQLVSVKTVAVFILMSTRQCTSKRCFGYLGFPRYEVLVHANLGVDGVLGKAGEHVRIWMDEHVCVVEFVVPEEVWILEINPFIIKSPKLKVVAVSTSPKLYLLRKILHFHDHFDTIGPGINLRDGAFSLYPVLMLLQIQFAINDRPKLHLATIIHPIFKLL